MVDYTNNKKLIKPAYNEYINTWNDPVNEDWDIIDKAFGGLLAISTSGGISTPSATDCQNVYIKVSGVLSTQNAIIKFPASIRGFYIVDNVTTGSYDVILASAGGTPGATVLAVRNACTFIYSDGSNILLADNANLSVVSPLTLVGNQLSITGPIPVTLGGTGANSLTANYVILGNGNNTVQGVAPGASGNVLTSNGTTWTSAPAAGSGGGVSSLGMYTATANGGLGLTFTSSATNPLTGPGSFTLGGTLNATYGGTGLATYAAGDLIYASGANSLSRLAIVGSGKVLKSGSFPSWGSVDLAADVTGNLSVNNLGGGTGASASTFWCGNGTWATPTVTLSTSTSVNTATIPTGTVLYNNGGTLAGAATIGSGNVVLATGATLSTATLSNAAVVRVGTATALSSAEAVSVFAAASTDGIVSKLTTNTQFNYVGQNSGGTETFTVDGNGAIYGTSARLNTATALSTAETLAVSAPASTDGVVSKVATNTQSTFIGQSSGGAENFTVNGNGAAYFASTIRSGTTSALSTAEMVSVLAPTSTDGVVSKVSTDTNFTFVGQSSGGAENFTVTGAGFIGSKGISSGTLSGSTGSNNKLSNTSDWAVEIKTSASGGTVYVETGTVNSSLIGWYYNNGTTTTNVANIVWNGTSVAYNQTSDYRLKNSVEDYSDGLTAIKELRPVTFLWNLAPNAPRQAGFIAHEVQAVIPHAVSGVKDAVDANGNILPQGIDNSFIVPHLVAAVQELSKKIEALEAKVAALEARPV